MTIFSVDVETTGLFPGQHGVTAFSIVEVETEEAITYRVGYEGIYPWDEDTKTWADQNMPDLSQYDSLHPVAACRAVEAFVNKFDKPSTFMAWPASFDYPMLQHLWVVSGRMKDWPFHYRTLDIKSMMCGKLGVSVDAKREDLPLGLWIEPDVEHDPYYDALAQLKTYKKLLEHNA